jgi:hypothetical protein
VRVFRLEFILEDAIELHAVVPLEALTCVRQWDSSRVAPLLLPVYTVNCVLTLKAGWWGCWQWQ